MSKTGQSREHRATSSNKPGAILAFIEAAACITLLMIGGLEVLGVMLLHVALRIAHQSRMSVIRQQLGGGQREQTDARRVLRMIGLTLLWLVPLTSVANTTTIALCVTVLAAINTAELLWRHGWFDDEGKSLLGSAG